MSNQVDIVWKPYQIDPGTAVGGEPFEDYNVRRWGSSSWTHHLRKEGAKDGANFSNWKWWPNTLRAHQWIQYGVERFGSSTDHLNSILFTALYEQGMNISLVDVLVELGKGVFPSCNEQELRTYLNENQGASQVRSEIDVGRRNFRINGVPFFVIFNHDNEPRAVFSGAQSSGYFSKVLQEVAAEE